MKIDYDMSMEDSVRIKLWVMIAVKVFVVNCFSAGNKIDYSDFNHLGLRIENGVLDKRDIEGMRQGSSNTNDAGWVQKIEDNQQKIISWKNEKEKFRLTSLKINQSKADQLTSADSMTTVFRKDGTIENYTVCSMGHGLFKNSKNGEVHQCITVNQKICDKVHSKFKGSDRKQVSSKIDECRKTFGGTLDLIDTLSKGNPTGESLEKLSGKEQDEIQDIYKKKEIINGLPEDEYKSFTGLYQKNGFFGKEYNIEKIDTSLSKMNALMGGVNFCLKYGDRFKNPPGSSSSSNPQKTNSVVR